MDVRQLRYFVAIVELGSFNRAAAELRVAQPALSRQIAMLERETGVMLLRREAGGSRPTRAGEAFAARAAAILRELEDARQEIVRIGSGLIEPIRLGIPPSLSVSFPMDFVATVQVAFPKISLLVREAWTGHLVELLVDKRIDCAVVSQTQLGPGMISHELVREEFCVVSQHRPRLGTVIDWLQLALTPLVLPPHPHGTRLIVESTFRHMGKRPNIVLETEVLNVMTAAVTSGAASAILSRRDADNQMPPGSFTARRVVKPKMHNTLVLARLSGKLANQLDPVFEGLATLLRAAITEPRRVADQVRRRVRPL
jgi:LysR family nitrogen assimilation transcriptional regulator